MGALATLAVATVLTATGDVRDVAQQGGVVWAATTGGVVRVGPRETRVFTPDDGLPEGTARVIRLERGHVWVGTDAGLVRMKRPSGRVVSILSTDAPVHALTRWRRALWVGTWDGLYRLDGGPHGKLTRHGEMGRVTALAGSRGLLYIATAGQGLHGYNGRRFGRIPSGPLCWDVAVRGRHAWVATSRGVRRYRRGRVAPHPAARGSRSLPVADVRAIRVTDAGLMAGTWGAGAFVWNEARWQPLKGTRALGDAQVHAFAGSPSAPVVATAAGLLMRGANGWTRRLQDGLPDNDLTSLARTEEGLWVGTFQDGLVRIRNGHIRVFRERHGLVDDRINRLEVDGAGDLWVATDRGVAERTGGVWKSRGLLGHHVFMIARARGSMWASAAGALWRWTGARWRKVAAHPGERPQDLTATRGVLYSATAEGLATQADSQWKLKLSGPRGLPDDWATAVAPWDDGIAVGTYNAGIVALSGPGAGRRVLHDDLWVNAGAMRRLRVRGSPVLAVGTLDQGLWLYDGDDWRSLTTADGLPDEDVTAILPGGEDAFWVATRGGLARITAPD
jgi:hypothetical protein